MPLFRDRKLAERDTQVPPLAGTRQSKRHLTLGHHIGLYRIHSTGVRLSRHIRPEQLTDAPGNAGELTLAIVDGGLADGEPAAPGAQLHLHRLPVTAVNGAATVGR